MDSAKAQAILEASRSSMGEWGQAVAALPECCASQRVSRGRRGPVPLGRCHSSPNALLNRDGHFPS